MAFVLAAGRRAFTFSLSRDVYTLNIGRTNSFAALLGLRRQSYRCFSSFQAKTMSSTETIPVHKTVDALRASLSGLPHPIALVPTMGALHAGHMSLVRRAALENESVIVSIFVNPTQFAPSEDLSTYPRTLSADVALLSTLNSDPELKGRVKGVFAPTVDVMYPHVPTFDSPGSYIAIPALSSKLEGTTRPTFFRGVTTVCMKLFHIVQPSRVYFGQKDVQQTVVIKRMVQDFCMDSYLEVVVVPTVRDAKTGLALSSRNVYLGTRRRNVATVLYRALRAAENAFVQCKERSATTILAAATDVLERESQRQRQLLPRDRAAFELDYISLADPDSLEELTTVDERKGAILSAAMRMLPVEDVQNGEDVGLGTSSVRLIDNIVIKPVTA